jgi:hypothetical protein
VDMSIKVGSEIYPVVYVMWAVLHSHCRMFADDEDENSAAGAAA